ncbi:hypothetical protein C2U70_00505 [Bradyrhizobium guangdongense]|nr:hypothetical protein C2U70_00505 [Bradyrhizobium guangdongense]
MGLKTHAYCETKPYKGILFVDKASSDPGVLGCITVECDGDHVSICKPTTRQSPIYLGARSFISDLIGLQPKSFSNVPPGTPPYAVSQELTQDDVYDALASEFENYTKSKDDPRLDLAEKLKLGGRAHEIPRALRLKEEFAKAFTRNQLQSSATQRYIKLLAEVDARFNSDVYPAIVDGASIPKTAALIKTHISDPIIEAHKSDPLVNHVVLDRMIYYLTGLCHIRWTP